MERVVGHTAHFCQLCLHIDSSQVSFNMAPAAQGEAVS